MKTFFHNIQYPSSYPDTVIIGIFWSSISQVPKLFGICHLLCLIRDTLGYNLYIVEYLQQVPFSPQYRSSYPDILIQFLSKLFNFQKNYRNSGATVPLKNVWSTILKEWNGCSILWYRIFGWFLPWIFSVNHLTLPCYFNISFSKIFGFCLC